MEKSLWAVKLKPKKPYQYLHSGPKLHLSQATLGLSPKGKQGKKGKRQRTIIKCKREGLPEIFICSLRPGTAESFQLDLLFDEDVEFSITGSTSVHLVGYFEGWDGYADGEEYDEDFIQDDISEDYDDDEDDNSIDEDEEEFENESEYDDSDEYDDIVPNTGVTIEELVDDEAKEARPKVKRDVESLDLDRNGTQSSEYVKNVNGCGHDESEDEDGFIFQRKKVMSAKEGSDDDENEDGFAVPEEQGAAPKEDKDEDEDKSVSAGKRKASVNENKPLKKSKVFEGPKDAVLEAAQETAKKKKKRKGAKKSSEDLPNNSKMMEDERLSSENEINLAIQAPEDKVTNDESITNVVDGTPQKGTLLSPEGKNLGKKGSPAVRKFPNGLEIEVLAIGKPDGKQAKPGKRVSMYYTGKLQSNGKIFDSKLNRKPFEFRLGVNEVIKGLDVGMNGMRVGDKRRITIPPQMGYGFKGVQGTVPGNSWLIFDVELVNVK